MEFIISRFRSFFLSSLSISDAYVGNVRSTGSCYMEGFVLHTNGNMQQEQLDEFIIRGRQSLADFMRSNPMPYLASAHLPETLKVSNRWMNPVEPSTEVDVNGNAQWFLNQIPEPNVYLPLNAIRASGDWAGKKIVSMKPFISKLTVIFSKFTIFFAMQKTPKSCPISFQCLPYYFQINKCLNAARSDFNTHFILSK